MSTEITEGEYRDWETNEPIGETAPMIYTKKTDGVIPAYDIRTDKWEIAQDDHIVTGKQIGRAHV